MWLLAPAVVVGLVLWGNGGGANQLVGRQAASAAQSRPADTYVDVSALATDQRDDVGNAVRRVSRSSRDIGARPLRATSLPARTRLPRVQPGKTAMGTWVRPSAGPESSCFCQRWGVFHEGIDLAGPLGSPIVAVGDGVVLEAGPSDGFGHWIVIRHSDGDVSIYGHMYTVLVSAGQRVTAGQHIADIGSDGQSTGPHLHFGVRQHGPTGPYIDPVPWLRARGINIGSYDPNA